MKAIIYLALCAFFGCVFKDFWVSWVFGIGAIIIMVLTVLKSVVWVLRKDL